MAGHSAGVNLSQDVPPLRWDVPPEIEKVGRPSHPSLKTWDGGRGLNWASLTLTYGSWGLYWASLSLTYGSRIAAPRSFVPVRVGRYLQHLRSTMPPKRKPPTFVGGIEPRSGQGEGSRCEGSQQADVERLERNSFTVEGIDPEKFDTLATKPRRTSAAGRTCVPRSVC
jgi:hypothetical protein